MATPTVPGGGAALTSSPTTVPGRTATVRVNPGPVPGVSCLLCPLCPNIGHMSAKDFLAHSEIHQGKGSARKHMDNRVQNPRLLPSSNSVSFVCPLCPLLENMTSKDFLAHSNNHNIENGPNKTDGTKVSSSVSPSLVCPLCPNLNIMTSRNFLVHSKCHNITGEEGKKNEAKSSPPSCECPICPHLGEMGYKDFLEHSKIHDNNAGEDEANGAEVPKSPLSISPSLVCPLCPRTIFMTSKDFLVHSNSHTTDERANGVKFPTPPSSASPSLVCPLCPHLDNMTSKDFLVHSERHKDVNGIESGPGHEVPEAQFLTPPPENLILPPPCVKEGSHDEIPGMSVDFDCSHSSSNDTLPDTLSVPRPARRSSVPGPRNKSAVKQYEEESLICPFCLVRFPEPHRVDDHMQYAHNGTPRYNCSVCKGGFHRPHLLVKHLFRAHHLFRCQHCEELYGSLDDLILHKKEKHVLEIRAMSFSCTLCGVDLSTSRALDKHSDCCSIRLKQPVRQSASSNKRTLTKEASASDPVACGSSNPPTATVSNDKSSAPEDASTGNDFSFAVNSGFALEGNDVPQVSGSQAAVGQPTGCSDVPKQKRRKISDIPDEEKPHKCPICNQKFTQRGHVFDHIQVVHKGIRFDCNMCSASYSQRVNLTQHRRKEGHYDVPREKEAL